MSKSRKRIFPKPPVKFHSKLADELGRHSNKAGFAASLKAIYYQEPKYEGKAVGLTDRQKLALEKLRQKLSDIK